MNHTKSPKIPISVLVVIYNHNHECLLIERKGQAEFWQSVTGSIENTDASLIQTACREVFEETGIAVTQQDVHDDKHQVEYEIFEKWRHRYAANVTHNTEHWFSLQVANDTPITLAPNEHSRFLWLPFQDAQALVFSPSNQDAIVRLAASKGIVIHKTPLNKLK